MSETERQAYIDGERERERDRQRQTERETKTERQRQTEPKMETERQRNRQAERQAGKKERKMEGESEVARGVMNANGHPFCLSPQRIKQYLLLLPRTTGNCRHHPDCF